MVLWQKLTFPGDDTVTARTSGNMHRDTSNIIIILMYILLANNKCGIRAPLIHSWGEEEVKEGEKKKNGTSGKRPSANLT